MNKLLCGDNLEIMREMPSESVQLIATDPPFNTGRDWGAFNDKWEDGLTGYLKFMQLRLQEIHRLLKPTGSFYLHCDSTASHYLKVMLDAIFGIKQFRNEIVWKRYTSNNNAKRLWAKIHDILLFYTKSEAYIFNPILAPPKADNYKKVDVDGRKYCEKGPDSRRRRKTRLYLDEAKGTVLNTLWIAGEGLQLVSASKERVDYPTQKPLALYERIIKASTNKGDLVLDPFCGSGTTLVASQGLGRGWIGIDQNPDAIALCEKRLYPAQTEMCIN